METLENQNDKRIYAIKAINIILVVVILLLALVLISMTFLWTPMTVSGVSMLNTLQDGEHVILLTAWYSIRYGDIIVFEKSDDRNIIKRVIGLGGDKIRFSESEGAYYRNGEKLIENYVNGEYLESYFDQAQTTIRAALLSDEGYEVPEASVFVLGDNRMRSNDSHIYGAISENQIIGKYILGY